MRELCSSGQTKVQQMMLVIGLTLSEQIALFNEIELKWEHYYDSSILDRLSYF
jgi:hypothetical protein